MDTDNTIMENKPKLLLMMFVDKKEQSHLSALVTVFSVTKQSGSSSSEQRWLYCLQKLIGFRQLFSVNYVAAYPVNTN